WIELLLHTSRIDDLPKIPFLIEETHSSDGNIQIACCFKIVSGKNAQASGIKRKGRSESELHAEIGDASEIRGILTAPEPARVREVLPPAPEQRIELRPEVR